MSDNNVISNESGSLSSLILPEGETSGSITINSTGFGYTQKRIKVPSTNFRWFINKSGDRILQQEWSDQLATWIDWSGPDSKLFWVDIPTVTEENEEN